MGSTERDRFSGGRGRPPPAAPGREGPGRSLQCLGSCCWVRSPFIRPSGPALPKPRAPGGREAARDTSCLPTEVWCLHDFCVSLLCPGAPMRSLPVSQALQSASGRRPAHSPAAKGSGWRGKRAEEGDGRAGKRGGSREPGLCSEWSVLLSCQQWSIVTRMTLG